MPSNERRTNRATTTTTTNKSTRTQTNKAANHVNSLQAETQSSIKYRSCVEFPINWGEHSCTHCRKMLANHIIIQPATPFRFACECNFHFDFITIINRKHCFPYLCKLLFSYLYCHDTFGGCTFRFLLFSSFIGSQMKGKI